LALLIVAMMISAPVCAEDLREIAPTGKLRVAFWSNRNESGAYSGVAVDLGKEMAAQLGVGVEYVAYQNSGQISDAASKGVWDVAFLPKDKERESAMSFGRSMKSTMPPTS
jgi:polar amino acid transport system substrate-binding protein